MTRFILKGVQVLILAVFVAGCDLMTETTASVDLEEIAAARPNGNPVAKVTGDVQALWVGCEGGSHDGGSGGGGGMDDGGGCDDGSDGCTGDDSGCSGDDGGCEGGEEEDGCSGGGDEGGCEGGDEGSCSGGDHDGGPGPGWVRSRPASDFYLVMDAHDTSPARGEVLLTGVGEYAGIWFQGEVSWFIYGKVDPLTGVTDYTKAYFGGHVTGGITTGLVPLDRTCFLVAVADNGQGAESPPDRVQYRLYGHASAECVPDATVDPGYHLPKGFPFQVYEGNVKVHAQADIPAEIAGL